MKEHINREINNIRTEAEYDALSDFEVFTTEETKIVYIERIISRCSVLNYEEYENSEKLNNCTFYCRASCDIKTGLLTPRFSEWERFCICNTPLNPDHLYIKCDKCDQWFHPTHCGLSDKEADEAEEFYCKKCIN